MFWSWNLELYAFVFSQKDQTQLFSTNRVMLSHKHGEGDPRPPGIWSLICEYGGENNKSLWMRPLAHDAENKRLKLCKHNQWAHENNIKFSYEVLWICSKPHSRKRTMLSCKIWYFRLSDAVKISGQGHLNKKWHSHPSGFLNKTHQAA